MLLNLEAVEVCCWLNGISKGLRVLPGLSIQQSTRFVFRLSQIRGFVVVADRSPNEVDEMFRREGRSTELIMANDLIERLALPVLIIHVIGHNRMTKRGRDEATRMGPRDQQSLMTTLPRCRAPRGRPCSTQDECCLSATNTCTLVGTSINFFTRFAKHKFAAQQL